MHTDFMGACIAREVTMQLPTETHILKNTQNELQNAHE